jgi:hypothetical protein
VTAGLSVEKISLTFRRETGRWLTGGNFFCTRMFFLNRDSDRIPPACGGECEQTENRFFYPYGEDSPRFAAGRVQLPFEPFI